MPYDSNADLPDSVKNNLPEHAQTIWRKAYENASGDADNAYAVAWSAVKNKYKKEDGEWKKKSWWKNAQGSILSFIIATDGQIYKSYESHSPLEKQIAEEEDTFGWDINDIVNAGWAYGWYDGSEVYAACFDALDGPAMEAFKREILAGLPPDLPLNFAYERDIGDEQIDIATTVGEVMMMDSLGEPWGKRGWWKKSQVPRLRWRREYYPDNSVVYVSADGRFEIERDYSDETRSAYRRWMWRCEDTQDPHYGVSTVELTDLLDDAKYAAEQKVYGEQLEAEGKLGWWKSADKFCRYCEGTGEQMGEECRWCGGTGLADAQSEDVWDYKFAPRENYMATASMPKQATFSSASSVWKLLDEALISNDEAQQQAAREWASTLADSLQRFAAGEYTPQQLVQDIDYYTQYADNPEQYQQLEGGESPQPQTGVINNQWDQKQEQIYQQASWWKSSNKINELQVGDVITYQFSFMTEPRTVTVSGIEPGRSEGEVLVKSVRASESDSAAVYLYDDEFDIVGKADPADPANTQPDAGSKWDITSPEFTETVALSTVSIDQLPSIVQDEIESIASSGEGGDYSTKFVVWGDHAEFGTPDHGETMQMLMEEYPDEAPFAVTGHVVMPYNVFEEGWQEGSENQALAVDVVLLDDDFLPPEGIPNNSRAVVDVLKKHFPVGVPIFSADSDGDHSSGFKLASLNAASSWWSSR